MESWKKHTLIFLTSQTLSLFGSSLVQYAILWHITLSTKSGVMMTISILCGFLPTFLLSPFAGVWADRYNRKHLIMISDSLIALTTLGLASLFYNGHRMIWLLFLASAIRALGTAVQTPAVGAFLPQIVPTEKLMRVNGLNGSIQSSVMIIAPILSGLLLSLSDIITIFMIDVVTALMAVLVLLVFLSVPSHRKAEDQVKTSYFTDLVEGLIYIRNHRFLKPFFLLGAVLFVLAAPAAFLTPLQVTRTFGDQIWRLTAIEITFSAGMILGGIGMAVWGGFQNRIHTMAIATLFLGAGTFGLGLVPWFWVYLILMTFVGVAMPIYNTPATVLLQEKVEEAFLGRVFGVMTMIGSTMMPFGMLVFGPLSDRIAIEWMLMVTGALMMGESYFFLRSKTLIEMGKQEINPDESQASSD